MEKMIGTGMVLMAAFMLSACGNDGKNAGGSESGKTDFSGEKLTIGVWGGNEAEEVSLNEMIKTFEKDTGAKIEKKCIQIIIHKFKLIWLEKPLLMCFMLMLKCTHFSLKTAC
ncbi:hypothetical protein GQR36_03440 [Enterococcus termitis]